MSASLSGLTIGTLELTPEFDPETTEYATATTNATNKVTATAYDEDATVTIELNGEEIDNESSAEWEAGENEMTITAVNGRNTMTYTVTVTKS